MNTLRVEVPPSYRVEDLPAEIASRIAVNPVTGCWEWQHKRPPHSDPGRYGWVVRDARPQHVFRVTYVLLAGPIPDDRPHLDHVYDWGCRARSCCWPTHLDAVTPGENQRRGRLSDAKRRRDPVAAMADPGDLVDLKEITKITGYSLTTLYAWRRQGAGPPTFLAGRHRVARRGDVVAWLTRYDDEHLIRRLSQPAIPGPPSGCP
jgi:predicted DNA-binding transcriptional regulator AlpA